MAAGARWTIRIPRLPLVAFGFIIVLAFFSCAAGSADAQELLRRENLFDRLFGRAPPREALPPVPQRQRNTSPQRTRPPEQRTRREQRARSRPPASAPAREQRPAATEKLDNALAVLVVGDFLASGLAEGLEAAYAESPGVRVIDRSNGSSGFVRDDFYDWRAQIEPALKDGEPAVVVVMIGSNDRQQLVVDGRPERPLTDAWRKEYVERVRDFAKKIEAAGIPLVWTGLPPFKSPAMSSDMLAFNDIYKQAAEEVSGTFVDIWDGFADENGAFVSTGPDMNGQPVRLRASDGINLTRPARRKVAFYVEQPLSKLLGTAVSPSIGDQELANLPPPGITGEPEDLERTRPIPLATLEPGGALLGAAPPSTSSDTPVPATQPGRADDFSLRRQSGARKGQENTRTAVEP